MAGETLPTGSTNTQGLADFAAPYITNYLGKAQALSETPYQTYQGPLTAGASNLQNKVFSGLAGLTFPSNLGQSFASPMGGNTNNYGGPGGPAVMPQQGGSSAAPQGNRAIPQYMIDANKNASALTALQPPENYGSVENMMEMMKSQQGGVPNYAMSGDYTGGKGFSPDTNNPLFYAVGAMPPGGGMQLAPSVSQAPRTEADWNKFASKIGFASEADYEKSKATFLAGGQGMPPQTLPSSAPSMPHQDYGSPQGIASLTLPQASQQPSNIAQSYMNPYLQNVLTPQLDELRRQNDITNAATNAKMTRAGGFGGGRQAIMNAENNRNLMMEQNKTVGQGYSSAYDKAMAQFNAEQGQSKDLASLMSTQGGIERGIESEGIAADKEEFEKQRQYPFQQVQFQRDMISGLPTGSVQNTPGQMSSVGSLLSALGGGAAAAKAFGYKDVTELLKGLGLDLGPN